MKPSLALKNLLLNVACVCMSMSVYAAESIRYQWSDTPLEIDLKVGVERNVHIPEANALRIGIPATIEGLLIPQIIGNHVWLKAAETFESTRVVLIAEPIGRLILQIQAQDSLISSQPIVISNSKLNSEIASKADSSKLGYVALTRWVTQQFYAPQRLVRELPGVTQISVDQSPVEIFRCGLRIPTLCSGAVKSVPLASWQSSFHYITALNVANELSDPIVLDPRELRGRWSTAAFIHTRLHPKGQSGDSTLLILISEFPFEKPQL